MAQIRIENNIKEADFTNNFVHSSNQPLILEIALKYQISSSYPQHNLVGLGIPIASKIVNIDGVRVHLILNWLLKNESSVYGLWGFPDEDKYVEKFTKVFAATYEIHINRNR